MIGMSYDVIRPTDDLLQQIEEFRAVGDAADQSFDIWQPRLDHAIEVAQTALWPHVAATLGASGASAGLRRWAREDPEQHTIAEHVASLMTFRNQTRHELPAHLRDLRRTAYALHAIARLYLIREQVLGDIVTAANFGCGNSDETPGCPTPQREGNHIMTDATEVDVRSVPPRNRHPLIFDTFDALPAGGTLRLVNDHDPRPLYYQFQAERAGHFRWEPAEEGPERWVILIHREA